MSFEDRWEWDEGDPEEIYFLEEEIASGTFGSVYKAINNETGKIAALKITQPEEDDDLSQLVELWILKHCDCPNIAKLYGTWRRGDETFIAMEYCGGGAVSDFYAVWGIKPTEDQIRLICRETLKGIKYLHSRNIIHRDIKGANILLTEDGDVKIIDFGVSAILKSPDEKRKTLIGTPYWMAPEIIANKTRSCPYDEKCDMWSIGITLIELAEKDPPLSQMNPMRALMQIPLREPPKLSDPTAWSQNFHDFLQLCLNREPRKRATLDQLLEHPFVHNCPSKSVLVDLIQAAHAERSRVLAAEASGSAAHPEDGDGDDDDDYEEGDAVDDPVPEKSPETKTHLEKITEKGAGQESDSDSEDDKKPHVPEATPKSEPKVVEAKSAEEHKDDKKDDGKAKNKDDEGSDASEDFAGSFSGTDATESDKKGDEKPAVTPSGVAPAEAPKPKEENAGADSDSSPAEEKKPEKIDESAAAASSVDETAPSTTPAANPTAPDATKGDVTLSEDDDVRDKPVTTAASLTVVTKEETLAKPVSTGPTIKVTQVTRVPPAKGSTAGARTPNTAAKPAGSPATAPGQRPVIRAPIERKRPMMQATATQHEQNLQKNKVSNRKLMKQQLGDMRLQVKKHEAEMDRLKAKLKGEKSELIRKNTASVQRVATKNEQKMQKLKGQQQADFAAKEKSNASDKKKLQRFGEERLQAFARDSKHLQSEAYAEFKKDSRKIHKDEVDFYKEEVKLKKANIKSTVDKKKRPEAEKALKEDRNRYVEHLEHWVDQRLFRFGVEQADRKFTEEIFLAWSDLSLLKDLDVKLTVDLHQMAITHLDQVYAAKVEAENERHQIALDNFMALHPVVLQHMAKEHELELVHQAKQQQTEKEQQQELMKYDQRAEFREFVKQRTMDEEQLKRTFKVFKQQKRKELNPKQIKDQVEKKRLEWQAEQDKKESEFLKQQRIEKEEEETLLRKYHENLVQKSKEAAEAARQDVVKKQKEEIAEENAAHDASLRAAEKEHWIERLDTIKKQHDEQMKTIHRYKSEHIALVKGNREDYVKLQAEWVTSLTTLCTTQNKLMELKDFQVILQQFVDEGLHKFDKADKMVNRVMDEEIQFLKLHHAEELNTCFETSPIDLISPDKNRKGERGKLPKDKRDSKKPMKKKAELKDPLSTSPSKESEIPSIATTGDSDEEDTGSNVATDGSSNSSASGSRRMSKGGSKPSKAILKDAKDKQASQSLTNGKEGSLKAPKRAQSEQKKSLEKPNALSPRAGDEKEKSKEKSTGGSGSKEREVKKPLKPKPKGDSPEKPAAPDTSDESSDDTKSKSPRARKGDKTDKPNEKPKTNQDSSDESAD